MAGQWQRCESCRKIKSAEEFPDGGTSCAECVAKANRPASARRAPVQTRTVKAAEPTPRPGASSPGSLTRGVAGRGDREVRARRARIRALEELAVDHPEEFEVLHAKHRAAEKLDAG